MGLFSRFLGKGSGPEAMLEGAIERLQIGLAMLLIERYRSERKLESPGDAALLANCVLSYATARNPIEESAKQYGRTHPELIRNEASNLATLGEISNPLSYLLAAITLLLAIQTRNPFSAPARQLGERAIELDLHIPNTFEICGSGDARLCIEAIAAFAEDFRRQLRTR